MKNYIHYSLAAFLLLFFFVSVTEAQTSSQMANRLFETWRTFSPAGKHFKVSLPAEPKELGTDDTLTVASALSSQIKKYGTSVQASFLNDVTVYNLDTRWNGFGIVVIDYKWQKIDYDEKSGVLTLSTESTTDEVVLREWLEFEKAKMHSPGVFFSEMAFTRDGKSFKARAYATRNRVFLLFVGMPDLNSATRELAGVYQAEADKFFNSFQILDNKPQIARGGDAKTAKTAN